MGRWLLLVLVAAALAAPAALADGDPASDYLLGQKTFVPPDDEVPPAYADQLQAAVRDANARGYTIRVALIGRLYDMGAVTVLFRKPTQYARFLGTELKFVYKGRLLVVMPNGLATATAGKAVPADQAVVDRIPPPGTDGAALASAGTKAVIRLAASAGVIVPEPPLASSGRGGSTTTRDRITIAAVAAVVAIVFGAFAFLRRRRRTA